MHRGPGQQTPRTRAEAVARGDSFPAPVSYNTVMGYPNSVATKGEYQEPNQLSQAKPFSVAESNGAQASLASLMGHGY